MAETITLTQSLTVVCSNEVKQCQEMRDKNEKLNLTAGSRRHFDTDHVHDPPPMWRADWPIESSPT